MTPHVLSALVAIGFSVALSVSAEPSGDNTQRMFANVSASVVTIKAVDEEGADDGQGSGVVISKGLVVTNCHVVREAVRLRVIAVAREYPGKWIREDPQRDICLLAVDGLSAPAVATRDSKSLVVGESVFAVGNPLGFGLAVSQGLVTAFDTTGAQARVVATAAVSPGSSGGGLFDREGRLVGITTAVLGTGQNLSLVLSADGLKQLATHGSVPKPIATPPTAERKWEDEAVTLQRFGDWLKLDEHAKAWRMAQPTSASSFVFGGMALEALKRHGEAADLLRRGLDLDDRYAFAWLGYGRALKSLGQRAEAEKALDWAETILPSYAEPSKIRAEWLAQEGRWEEARRQMTESLRRDPGRSGSWRYLGVIEDGRGDNAAALRAYKVAARLGDTSPDGAQRLAQLLAGTGKVDEASRVAANTALGKKEAALTQVALGLAELKRNRLGPAEEAASQAIRLDTELADAWNLLGSIMLQAGRKVEAEHAYDKAVKLEPNNPEPLANRANIRRDSGRTEAALEDARRAVALGPNNAPAWRIYGAIQTEARNFREAAAAFSTVERLGQATIDDLVSLGDSQAEMGDMSNALKVLARAEAMNANHVRMCLSMAKAVGRMGDIARALSYEERALKQEPTNVQAWSGKGYALMKLGRMPEAVEALETTVRLAPELANGWINLGEAQMRSLNLGRAIQALEKAITLAPEATDARLFLAQSYIGARLPVKAREQAERLLNKKPDFSPALGLLAITYLMEGNASAATLPYTRMRTLAPTAARALRDRAITSGFNAAKELPD